MPFMAPSPGSELDRPAGKLMQAVSGVFRRSTPRVASRPTQTAPTIDDVLASTQLEAPRHPLEEQIEVAGETYNVKGIKRVFADNTMPITERGSTLEELRCILMPEPWNPYDPNAVAVLIDRHMVGHVPADLAADYSAPLGALASRGYLATGQARLWAKSDSGVVRARVTILVPEAAAFTD
jgi:hypothetical protein